MNYNVWNFFYFRARTEWALQLKHVRLEAGESSVQSARLTPYQLLRASVPWGPRGFHSLRRACSWKATAHTEQFCITTAYWRSIPLRRQTDTESPGQAISLHTGESLANQNGVSDTGNSLNKKRASEMEWVKFTKQESLPRILGHFYLGGFTLCIFCRKLSSLNWPLIILTATTVACEDYEAVLGLCAGPGEGRTCSLSSPQLEEPSALPRALTKAHGRGWGGEINIGSVRLSQALLFLLPTAAPTKSRWRV